MYEVKQYTLDHNWLNCWTIWDNVEGEKPQVFDSVEEAQEEMDKFFADINNGIMDGTRCVDDIYDPNEFMIAEVDDLIAA